ncbi:MKRN2 opposite strand protein [Aedes albopictus]|uniref:MKRN2 opposite strand protein n=1 Tax=Aedes albopictus TaxID=7160 RepID=A0ABM1YWI1_AEDAL
MTHNRDPDVVCFKHCGRKIFVFAVPSYCPVCGLPLTQSNEVLPFTLPYPFINATQSPCSVILCSSRGDFLSNFRNSVNLHIALTDSIGSIVEFDSPGLLWTPAREVDKAQWGQCLLVMQVPEAWFSEWDRMLRMVIDEEGWKRRQYDEELLNCYSFVLDFLRYLKYEDFSLFVNDRQKFSTKFIVPKSTYAAKYITIFRRVKESGCWADEMNSECS